MKSQRNSLFRSVALQVCFVINACLITSGQGTETSVNQFNSIAKEAWDFRSIPNPGDPDSKSGDAGPLDISRASIDKRSEYWSEVIRELEGIPSEEFTKEDKINYDVFRYIVEDEVAKYTYDSYLMPFNAEGGFHTGFAFRANRTLRSEQDIRKYVEVLKGFPGQVNQNVDLMREGVARGFVMPCEIVESFENTAKTYLVNDISESVFYKPIARSGDYLTEDQLAQAESAVTEAIKNYVQPGYQKLAIFLEHEYVPACRSSIGAIELPDGEAYYEQRIRHFTTLDMSAKEVFEIGQKEVARIKAEMEMIIEGLGFEGSFSDFLEFLRTDSQFYAKSPRELLSFASYIAKRVDGKLPAYFGKLPRLSYGVDPVPDEIAPRYTGGRYVQGSQKDGRSGTYWVNTYQLESRPLYVLPSLTLHEAVPGHHLQISLSQEMENQPDYRTDYYISAFGEGWALYTEYLGKEMGIYETPYEEFGALTYEMWRACRLVVDPGMHAFGWSREEAVKFMAENTALSMHEVNTEINRYIGWPGQAVSYKIGELKIRDLRRQAETALGDQFDLREFHDVVLENGSIPLFVLEEVIENWIAVKRANTD